MTQQDDPLIIGPTKTGRRVALLTHGFADGGGVPTMAKWLRRQLEEADGYTVDVHVLATSSSDVRSRRVREPKTWKRSLGPTYDASLCAWLWGANATEFEFMRYAKRAPLTSAMAEYDIVHVVCGAPAWATPVLGLGVPVVLQFATLVTLERQSAQRQAPLSAVSAWRAAMTRVTARLETPALKRADAVLTINNQVLHHVESLGQTQVFNAAPGTDTEAFTPNPEWDRRGYLLSVCRFGDQRKGLERMVRAYSLMVRNDPSMPVLVLAGRGEVPQGLKDSILALGLQDRVALRQDVPAEDLPSLYRSASVYLQTSYEEGFGISVVEAMASGIPVVATKTDGTMDTIVDGRTGWLVNQGSDDQVSSQVAMRVAEILHDDAGETLSKNARNHATSQYSIATTFAAVTRAYDAVLFGG